MPEGGETMIRIGPALPGSTPFIRDDGGVRFDGQGGRVVDFGHTFDRERGYRVFFKFQDSPAANTWGAEDLLRWLEFEPADDDARKLQSTGRRLARQVIRLNRAWEAQGRPSAGLSIGPGSRA